MQSFEEIMNIAAERKGGQQALEDLLTQTPVKTAAEIAQTPDDRILSAMTRRIFYAGLSHKMIDNKWPAFEEAFVEFNPTLCAAMSDEWFERLIVNTGIVRNAAKIRAVQKNAQFVLDLAAEHGSAGQFFAEWPDDRYVELLDVLKKRGSYLGGDSGMRFLRLIGRSAFVLSSDVVAALIRAGVVTKAPSSKGDFARVQEAINAWAAESGRNLTEMSRVLAMSIGDNYTEHDMSRWRQEDSGKE